MESTMTTDGYGNKCWRNAAGKRHRSDGPAVERIDGTKEWCLNGQHHRTDGPAVEWAGGSTEWWVDDEWLGNGAEGFWTFWDRLSGQQRMDLNVQLWAAKYT